MADQFDSSNPDLNPTQTYYNWGIPLPPQPSTTTNIEGDVTIVTTINGASGPSINLISSIGFAFTGGPGGNVVFSVSNATLARAALVAAKSGVNTDITELNGASQVDVSGDYKVDGTQVVQERDTGWTAPTGTGSKAGYDTSTATLTEVAQTLKELIDQLFAHGLIGT